MAVRQVAGWLPGRVEWVIASGSGEFLISLLLRTSALREVVVPKRVIPFSEFAFGHSTVACAYAVAALCEERFGA